MQDNKPIQVTKQEDLPVFTGRHLPAPVHNWCHEIAKSLDVCPSMPIAMATAIVSSLYQEHFEAELYPGYTECLAHYSTILAEPGERKTAVWKALLRPIRRFLGHKQSEWIAESKIKEYQKKQASEQIKRMIERGKSPKDIAPLAKIAEQPTEPRQFIVEDFTSAALAQILAVSNSILITTDEGDIWKKLGKGYNDDISLLLRSHTGEPYQRNRKGNNENLNIERPVASMAISMQPSLIHGGSLDDTLSGQGLTARFFFTMPKSMVGKQSATFKPHDTKIEAEYASWAESTCRMLDEYKQDDTIKVSPTERGQQALLAFSQWCIWESRRDDEATKFIKPDLPKLPIPNPSETAFGALSNMRGWSSKLAGHAIRIAALRAVHRIIKYHGKTKPQITYDDACHAIKFCIDSIEHMEAVNKLFKGENWSDTSRALAILNGDGWPQNPIQIGRLANILSESSSSRKGVNKVITDLIEKEHLIQIDAKTVRANSIYLQVSQ